MMKLRVLSRIGVLCLVAGMAFSSVLNEWTFELDGSGVRLSDAVNSGTDAAVFANGGDGVLLTDGQGGLKNTYESTGTAGMWTDGCILDAAVPSIEAGVHYLRYDCEYDLSDPQNDSGTLFGMSFTDDSGAEAAGVYIRSDWGSPETPSGLVATEVAGGLATTGRVVLICRVNLDTQTMDVWCGLNGVGNFDEASPTTASVSVQLSSIDNLRFHATGDFAPAGSDDGVCVDNIRMADSWDAITKAAVSAVKPNVLFRDGMVLQRDFNAPVWGTAASGMDVDVLLDGELFGSATTDDQGEWMARIEPREDDGGIRHTVTVRSTGVPDVVMTNVVFGDVYLMSGQSNMARLLPMVTGYADEAAQADYPLLRQVRVARVDASAEQEEVALDTGWLECSPSTAAEFGAVAYFFGKNVYQETGIPIGMIHSAWGGQKIQRFLNSEGLGLVPELAGMQQYVEGGGDSEFHGIYNAMVAPLAPYGIRGVIWYQGEANQKDGNIYEYKMRALMRGWRELWGQGDFPFYYVQLPNFNGTVFWAELRESQRRALTEPNCGMIVTVDVGEDEDVHPTNKQDPGSRLARWTLARDYQREIVYSGPLYYDLSIEGDQVRVIFDHAEGGLMIGTKDGTNPVVTVDGPLQNFEVAGADGVFTAADAVIDRDTVLVSSPTVSAPVDVRYCYAPVPSGSNKLYNAAGLPASPFRTDESYRLDVKSGSGTVNDLTPGEQVLITADVPPAGQVFDRWIGAISEVDDLNASSATVTMPNHALFLVATYRDVTESVYQLTVNGGAGSGTSKAGSVLNIEAAAPADGEEFDCWNGDTQAVVNVHSACTTLRMPSNNVSVTAVYKLTDTIGDGVSNQWRADFFGGDGASTNAVSAASADPDGDGATNLQEYHAGTNPLDDQSVLRVASPEIAEQQVLVSFKSVKGKRYRVESCASLSGPSWETGVYNISGDGAWKHACCPFAGSEAFYRLQTKAL